MKYTDTDRLNWLIDNEAYYYIDPESYPKFSRENIKEAIRKGIDEAMDKNTFRNIEDWFNVHDTEHLKAFMHLQNMGAWPKNFLPDYITCSSSNWYVVLLAKICDAYLTEKNIKE